MKTLPPDSASPPRPPATPTPGPAHPSPTAPLPPVPVLAGALRDGWRCEVFAHSDGIAPALWRALFPSTWKDRRFYQTLEETFAREFAQFYLVLRDGAGQPRALQPLFIVEQDVTVSLPRLLRRLLGPARRWLTFRLLMVGCIVTDGRIGVPGLAEVPGVLAPLEEAVALFARHRRVRLVLFKDLPASYRPAFAARADLTRLPSLPGVQLRLDFATFEEYVQTRLGRSTRKSLRRKYREIDALTDPVRLEVKTRVTPREARVLHALYERVARRGDRQFEVFTPEYFLRLGERMPEHVRYFVWKRRERVVAFNFCAVHGDTIHDNDLGMDPADALPLHLYYLTFRDIVRWALAHGLKYYQSSPFDYLPKLHLRMELVPLDLYVRHTSPTFNRWLRRLAPLAAPTRTEESLPFFPNAGQLV